MINSTIKIKKGESGKPFCRADGFECTYLVPRHRVVQKGTVMDALNLNSIINHCLYEKLL